jgi:hypothetical protein
MARPSWPQRKVSTGLKLVVLPSMKAKGRESTLVVTKVVVLKVLMLSKVP